jgi:hypothetical protein
MANKVGRSEFPPTSPSIRKVNSRILYLGGRVNKSADQIDYESNRSVFLSFSQSKDDFEKQSLGKVEPNRRNKGLEMVRDLLSHNKEKLSRSLEKVSSIQRAKTEEASIIYSNLVAKTEITLRNQRISKGFFMKYRPSGMPGKGLPSITSYSRKLLAGKLFKGVCQFH